MRFRNCMIDLRSNHSRTVEPDDKRLAMMEVAWFLYSLFLVADFVSGEMSPEFVFDVLSRRIDSVLTGRRDDIQRVVDKIVEDKIGQLELRMEQRIENVERENEESFTQFKTEFTTFKEMVETLCIKDIDDKIDTIGKSMERELSRLALVSHKFASSEKAFLREMIRHSRAEMSASIRDTQLQLSAFNQTLTSSERSIHDTFVEVKDELQAQYENFENESNQRHNEMTDILNSFETTISGTKKEITEETLAEVQQVHEKCSSMVDRSRVEMESIIAKKSTEIRNVQAEVKKVKTDVISNQDYIKRRLISEISDLETEMRRRHKFRGFTARLSGSGKTTYGQREVIKFNKLSFSYNTLNGYDKTTGIFTVPVSGWYLFIFFVQNTKDGKCGAVLYKNGRYLSEAVAGRGYDSMGGNAVTVYATKGDRVWVQTAKFFDKYVLVDRSRPTFTGILIEAQ